MKIVHISDTHSAQNHSELNIPECDVLIHTGDLGGRTNIYELTQFLVWFVKQPGKKIFIAGNHDLILDKEFFNKSNIDSIQKLLFQQIYESAIKLIKSFDITYLNNEELIYKGIKFYGSPYTPSFFRDHWAFNRDRGDEIITEWKKIPNDTNILLTHGPCYKILDGIKHLKKNYEDPNKGCNDLLNRLTELPNLKLHCFGHIHENYGVIQNTINKREILFSNGAILNNAYQLIVKNPLIINI